MSVQAIDNFVNMMKSSKWHPGTIRKKLTPKNFVPESIVLPGKMHITCCRHFPIKTTRAKTLPVISTVHATAILCSTNDVLNANEGTIHSFACPCSWGFAVFGSACIKSRKHRKQCANEKTQWTDTEEKILIELFSENEDKLCYWSFKSPEWQSIARQLLERCRRENVESKKSSQQCKY